MNRPTGYLTRGPAERICFGDMWLRPCDKTWVEVGTAMVGLYVGYNVVAARDVPDDYKAYSRYLLRQQLFDKLRSA